MLLGIEPWNFPLYQVVRVAAPNIVLGNTILLKHSEVCPQSALALEKLFADAGAPAGVYTNVFLHRDDVERVIADPAVQGVALTGSERAGSAVAALAGKHLKKCVLELGGSDPFIVLDGENLERTASMAVVGRMGNTGQSCIAAKRLMVVEDVYDDFVEAIVAKFSDLAPGDPADPSTTLGPLSSERAAQGLDEQIQDAVDRGAVAHVGGGRPDHDGAFVSATVLTGVTPGDARVVRGAVRAGRGGLQGARRGRGGRAGQLLGVRAGGGGVQPGPRPGTQRRRPPRERHGLGQRPHGLIGRAAVRRREAFRVRPGALGSGLAEFANRKLVRTMPPRKKEAAKQ